MAGSPPSTVVYHLELRAFPHVARAFNLDRETLDRVFVKPYATGDLIDYDDRRWTPDKTRLTVFEGASLEHAAVGLGRGWGEVTRHGRDVTETVLAEIQRGAEARPELEALKLAIVEVASQPVSFRDVIALAAAGHPQWRASEQLSLAEQAVWEMLHRHQLEMLAAGAPVGPERWQEIVLSWASWTGEAAEPLRLCSMPAA